MENYLKKQKSTLEMEAILGIMLPVNMMLYIINAANPNVNPFVVLIICFIFSAIVFGVSALACIILNKTAKPLSEDEELKYKKVSLILDIIMVVILVAVFSFSCFKTLKYGVSIQRSTQICIIVVADALCALWNFIKFVEHLREYKTQQKSDITA